MTHFYHATCQKKWLQIKQSGQFLSETYFAISEIADYYASTIRDEGKTPVIIAIPQHHFDDQFMAIDHNGLAEPVCFIALGKRDTQIFEEWELSDQTVVDCIEIIGSFQYKTNLPLCECEVFSL